MKHLLKINADSEAVFKDHDVVYYSQNSDKSYIMKHYDNPFIKIFMSNSYHDTSIIPLIAKKYGNISGEIIWSHNLGDKATIEDGVIRLLQHYTGTITVTATAGGKSASHTASIDCEEIPTSYTYSILNVSKPTANWDDTSAEISFTYRVAENYPLKPPTITDTPHTVTVNFPKNTTNYSTSNQYVDFGLSTGLKWATCNIGAQNETEDGLYFQWGDTEGYSGYVDPDVKRTGTFDFENVEDTPWEVTQKGFQKVFDWAHYKYCQGSASTMTKYCMDASYGTVDGKSLLDTEDDAAIQHLRSQAGHENARMPTSSEYQTLRSQTLWVWSPGGKVGVKKTNASGDETIVYVDYPKGYFVFKVKSQSDKGKMGTFSKDDATGNLNNFINTEGVVYYPGAHSVTEGVIDGDTHIFFPASGYCADDSFNSRGSIGYYWSNSLLDSISSGGRTLGFSGSNINTNSGEQRCIGICIRAVSYN